MKKNLTDTQLAEKITNTTTFNIEAGHMEADKILYEFLISIDYPKAAEAFNKLEKWYS